MENTNDKAPTKDPIKELFGPPPPRRPIPSNSFNTLVKIFSLFSDQSPFSDYASHATSPEYSTRCQDISNDSRRLSSDDIRKDVVVPRGEKEALPGSDTVETRILSVHDHEANNKGISGEFCEDISFSGSKKIIVELGRTNRNKTMDKMPSDEEGTSTGMTEVDKVLEELSGIERSLMDETDDFGAFQLADKDVNFELLNDFSCILNTDVCDNNSLTVENSGSEKLTVDGNMNREVAGEKKQKDLEVNRSGDEAKSHSHLSVFGKISDSREAMNQYIGTYPEEPPRKQRKLSKEKTQDLSEFGDLTFSAQNSNNGGTVSNSIKKGNKFDVSTKGKTKKVKDTPAKDANSGKSKLLVVKNKAFHNLEPGGSDPIVRGKMTKQSAALKKVGVNQPKGCEKFQYSRLELLNLWKMTSVPEDILKIVREIDAEVHGKHQSAGKMTEAGGAKKERLGPSTENKKAEEQGSCIPKNKKRGSSSEARKEKKKKQRRKKRAEMDKKLGVKRLKLQPIMKPKVIQPCRHYLKGRCQEGEKCKFSHDVIPLTKSKPCCHFARQACMKGDDCPFDHQLSKYPCNSYVAAGSCSRGDSCLFSHKISAKEESKTMAGVSKCETSFLDQFDKSNSEQQLNAKLSSSGIANPKSLKENVTMQTSLLAKTPRGLSFLSSGKSSVKDSGKQKEADFSQKSDSAVGTSNQEDTAKTTAVNVVKALMDTPASDVPQGTDFIKFLRTSVCTSGEKKQDSPSFYSFGKLEKLDSFYRSNDAAGARNQLNKGMLSKVQSFCGMPKANPATMNCMQTSAPSSGGPSHGNCDGKSQATLPTIGHPGSGIREKESANGSEKAIQPKLWDSPTSSGQWSTKVGVKNTPGTAQRALLSTLAFAAKYESGIKTSAGSAKEVTKNEGTISGSGCRQNEPSKASALLEFLYSGGNKEKQ